jgi:hypothetical protein
MADKNWIQKLMTRLGAPAGASISADVAANLVSLTKKWEEVLPASVFDLAVIPTTLAAPPPTPTAANTVVKIDAVADYTFSLRDLIISTTSFGTGTKLTFSLWKMVNGVLTDVDDVEVSVLGIQNMMDIFGLQEVVSDAIYVTVVVDAGATGACEGTYQYAKAK